MDKLDKIGAEQVILSLKEELDLDTAVAEKIVEVVSISDVGTLKKYLVGEKGELAVTELESFFELAEAYG